MEFDERNITIMTSLNRDEAKVYIKFLLSERARHTEDIIFIDERIKQVKKKFGWEK